MPCLGTWVHGQQTDPEKLTKWFINTFCHFQWASNKTLFVIWHHCVSCLKGFMECSQPLSGIKRRSQAREHFHHRPVFLFPPQHGIRVRNKGVEKGHGIREWNKVIYKGMECPQSLIWASFPSKGAFPPFFVNFPSCQLGFVKINHLRCKEFEYENVNHRPERHLRRRIGATVKAVKASCDPVSSFGKIVWRRSAKNSLAVAKNRRHCW